MKGNMFLGYARGSVGDVTFSRVGGQQVARARNRQPANPRTAGQVLQRSVFSNAVKFFSKGRQKLFKYAFEDKLPNESDYNAFMRHNVALSVAVSKQAVQSDLYPSLGEWILTAGSMQSPNLVRSEIDNVCGFACPSASSNMTTFAEFFAAIKADFALMEGDIVTIVHLTAVGATPQNMPSIEVPSGLNGNLWEINQYQVNSEDTRTLPGYIEMDNGKVLINYNGGAAANYAQGVGLIFSRPRSGGAKVSNSRLVGNEALTTIINACNDENYKELVKQSWQFQEEAILQGSLAESVGQGIASTTLSFPVPAEDMSGTIKMIEPVTDEDVISHLKFSIGGDDEVFYSVVKYSGQLRIYHDTNHYNILTINGKTINVAESPIEGATFYRVVWE